MRHRTGASLITLIVLLAGCQSAPSIPEHKYYRLQAPIVPARDSQGTRAVLPDTIAVLPLRAEGLYSERAMAFSDAQQRTLQQYHYHHWLYPPDRMVQEYLVERLRQMGIAPAVRLSERGDGARYVVSGRIMRFERIATGSGKAAVTLELRVDSKSRELWQRSYAMEAAARDDSLAGFAAAMEIALDRICEQFVDDLQRVNFK